VSAHRKMTLRLCSPLAAWIFILLIPGLSEGGKLLVVPMIGSHWLSMKEVIQKLAERGHEVVVLKPQVSWHTGETEKHAYTVKTYPVSTKFEELDDAFRLYAATHLKGLPFPLYAYSLYNISTYLFESFYSQCRELFDSMETLQYLNQSGFDAVLTDPLFMCGATVANYLSLPFVFLMRGLPCNLHFEAAQSPSPLSYVPRTFSFNSDHMTFFQRVENTLIALLELFYCHGYYRAAKQLSSEVLQRDVTPLDLLNSASISIMRFDFVFEYPRPVMPNMVFIGGMNCARKKPLPKVCCFSQVTFSKAMLLHGLWTFGALDFVDLISEYWYFFTPWTEMCVDNFCVRSP
uniref:glucuronosyltransferase n=1 Tax=Coturnix japonica TaxID=93934 RepID=A0A8C2TLH8_COTJA